jgi:transcriptional regulator with XRE-family HTH domain
MPLMALASSGDTAIRSASSYLSQLEKGSFHVSIKIIGKLASKLGAEPEEFLKRPTKRRSRSG